MIPTMLLICHRILMAFTRKLPMSFFYHVKFPYYSKIRYLFENFPLLHGITILVPIQQKLLPLSILFIVVNLLFDFDINGHLHQEIFEDLVILDATVLQNSCCNILTASRIIVTLHLPCSVQGSFIQQLCYCTHYSRAALLLAAYRSITAQIPELFYFGRLSYVDQLKYVLLKDNSLYFHQM